MLPIGPGTILHGRFAVVRALGKGGTATVWLALDRLSEDRVVALKVLHPELRRKKRMVERLEKEGAILRELAHPGIAAALGFFEDEQHVSLAMEYVEGVTFERWLGERNLADRPLSLAEVGSLFEALLAPIEVAHARGVLHRDLKPQNIMIADSTGALKVLDFGIAKLLEGDLHDATTQGRRVGSPFYMSPEQTRGDPPDARSDVFALGSIVFEMLTLRRAWLLNVRGERLGAFVDDVPDLKANAILEISARIAAGERPRASRYRLDLGAAAGAVDRFFEAALAIAPEARIGSIGELREEFRRAFFGEELRDTVPTRIGDAAAPRAGTPALEGTAVLEKTPALEGTAVLEKTPALEGTAVLEKTPVLERTPANDRTAMLEPTAVLTRPTMLSPKSVARSRSKRAVIAAAAIGLGAIALAVAVLRSREPAVIEPVPAREAPKAEVTARAQPKALSRAEEGSQDTRAKEGAQDTRAEEGAQDTFAETGEGAPRDPQRGDSARIARKERAREKTTDPTSALDAMLADARAKPADVARMRALAAEIARVAENVADETARKRIRRVAESSAITGDLDGLESALEELRRGVRR